MPVEVIHGDCVEGMGKLRAGSVDLAFADPPFNVGYEYDVYQDSRSTEDYLDWCGRWGAEIKRILKPDGSFWLAIGDEYAAELKILFHRKLGFSLRSWVIWYYTFGVNASANFSRSHTHLFYFCNDPKNRTFNKPAIAVPSARELVYNDKRAAAGGRIPDNTWILRPQDAPGAFQPDHDVWHESRVCGTFGERLGWHSCQMPERVLARIILASSNPGDLIVEPFNGSGTTLAVAKKLGRRGIGFELSENYAERARVRLEAIQEGDQIAGEPYAKPTKRTKPVAGSFLFPESG